MLVEIVCISPEDCVAAEEGGAQRLELCSAMALAGLTPSVGTMKLVAEKCQLPVMAMVRPRTGGFCYTDLEFESMLYDVEALKDAGAKGIVFGILDENANVDAKRSAALLRAADGLETVFHRAFDVTADPLAALDVLIDLGVQRLLTSGQQPNALLGADLIRGLIERADGRIEILPGGGVKPHNVVEVIEKTGVDQIHLGLFGKLEDPSMRYSKVQFNSECISEDSYGRTDVELVRQVVELTSSLGF